MIGLSLILKPAEVVINNALAARADRATLLRGVTGRSMLVRHHSGLGVALMFTDRHMHLSAPDDGDYDLLVEGNSTALLELLKTGEPGEGLKVSGEVRIARALMHIADAIWPDISGGLFQNLGPMLGGKIEKNIRVVRDIMDERQNDLKLKLREHLAQNDAIVTREEFDEHASKIDQLRRAIVRLEAKAQKRT